MMLWSKRALPTPNKLTFNYNPNFCAATCARLLHSTIPQLLLISLVGMLSYSTIIPSVHADSFANRQAFSSAKLNLELGRNSTFRKQAKQLQEYPLHPYLTYYDLNRRLSSVSTKTITNFLAAHSDLAVTPILKRRWLRSLGRSNRWSTLLEHYDGSLDPQLRCYYLRALYRDGERDEALSQTAKIWTQPTSQPKACDPLFEVWRASKYFTQDVAWQRLSAAINANERTLARYLIRYFSDTNKQLAQQFYNVHVNPNRISAHRNFKQDSPKSRQVIQHGLQRLAQRDAQKAADAWQRYQANSQFGEVEAQMIAEKLTVAFADEGTFALDKDTNALLPNNLSPGHFSPHHVEQICQAAVEHQNWQALLYWHTHLDHDTANKAQWQYWIYQAHKALAKPPNAQIEDNFKQLATQRHYYGFLAAAALGNPGRLNSEHKTHSTVNANQVRRQINILRAIELFAVGDDVNGRREWYAGLQKLQQHQQVIAAYIAYDLGLVPLAIRTANIAEARNHLSLRFPKAHEPAFRQGAMRTGLPLAMLFAVARQESALASDARSTADARGLLQMLPSTAKLVARRANVKSPSPGDLYDPNTNILLGSHHLGWLMQRYANQAPLVFAAYNAGEHRVDRWIKDKENLSMDIWIEQIPFRETRNYVKNVLAFRHVYAQLLNQPMPILTVMEQTVRER